MYIKINEKNEIIGLITGGTPANGGEPVEDWIEVDDVPAEVRFDFHYYKYVDGEFVLREDVNEIKLEKVRNVKIPAMRDNCRAAILKGFDHSDGHHYSLQESDQLKLQVLSIQASQGQKTSWKYDDGPCQFYTPEEMLALTTHAINYIAYHQTYFNQLKDQIRSMTDLDAVIAVSYGMELDAAHTEKLKMHTSNEYTPTENELGKDQIDPNDYHYILTGQWGIVN